MSRLKKNRAGSIVTHNGNISKRMQAEFKQMVKKANNQRDYLLSKMFNAVKNMPTMNNIDKKAYAEILQEKGFLQYRVSESLGQFETLKDFKKEMKDLNALTSTKYNEDKITKARRVMREQIEKNFNSDGDEILEVIDKLTDTEFIQLYTTGPDTLVKTLYYYTDDTEEGTLKTLSDIEITIRNMTPKKQRKKRMEELGFTYKM